jgi:hypothetical protein
MLYDVDKKYYSSGITFVSCISDFVNKCNNVDSFHCYDSSTLFRI